MDGFNPTGLGIALGLDVAPPLPSRPMFLKRWVPVGFLVLASCGGTKDEWARDLDLPREYRAAASEGSHHGARAGYVRRTVVISDDAHSSEDSTFIDQGGAAESPAWDESAPGVRTFRNTYYNFPVETTQGSGAVIYDAQCRKIADVSQSFHDALCVQGSGRIASGRTVSFARRHCECASVCPRTGQQICFEALDPAVYPWGRGALGKPITPLSTVAVDTSVIPFRTKLFIPDAVGLPRQDGSPHDGCFVAEDRGLKIIGEHVDIFTGDTATTKVWNSRLPSNRGVRVIPNAPECAD